MTSPQTKPVLTVTDLSVALEEPCQSGPIVADLSFTIGAGEMLALVGESGSGKSLTAAAIMGLLPWGIRHCTGSVQLEDQELVGLSEKVWRGIRGREIGLIFQNPLTALNPSLSIQKQLREAYGVHRGGASETAKKRTDELLREVGLAHLAGARADYPHQLSGGMRQRLMIAMALACRPRLLIADEPTTALDVLVQTQILDLLKRLQKEQGLAVLFITHNLALAARYADRILVLYAGRRMEEGEARTFFQYPRHPYSRALRDTIPTLENRGRRLVEIAGAPPTTRDPYPGCVFAPRCPKATEECRSSSPPWRGTTGGYACFHPCRGPSS